MTSVQDFDRNSIMELFNQIDSTYQKLLIICSWLAADEVLPLDVISKASEKSQEEELKQKLIFLASMNFLIHKEEEYVIQSKVAAIIQEAATPILVRDMLQKTSRAMYDIAQSIENTQAFEPFVKHVERLAQQGQLHKIATAGLLFGLLGRHKLLTQEYDEAVNFIRRALLIIEKVSGVESVEHTENLNNLGSALHRLGRFEDAKKCFDQAIIIDKKILDKNDPAIAVGHNNLGQVLIDLNSIDGAIIHLEKALEINVENFGNDHPMVASSNYNLGMALLAIKDLPRARAQLELALAKRKKHLGANDVLVAEAQHGLGMILQTIGNVEGAKEHYQEAIRIFELGMTENNLKLAASYTNLAGVLHAEGNFDEAGLLYKKALTILSAGLPENDKSIRDLRLQMKLLDHKMTMQELLTRMETGADLPNDVIDILSLNIANAK